MVTLISLAPEIQQEIVKKLKFPDLTRLRKTCRYMRDLPSHEINRQALIRLEEDWITASDAYLLFRQAMGWKEHNSSMTGCRLNETVELQWLVPCYQCLLLKKFDNFEQRPGVLPATLRRMTPQSHPTTSKLDKDRECIDCLLKRVNLPQCTPRYINTASGVIMACVGCKQNKHVMTRCGRQLNAALCNECFVPERAKWDQHKAKIKAARKTLAHQLKCMEKIERGGFDEETRHGLHVVLPTGLETPDFKYLD